MNKQVAEIYKKLEKLFQKITPYKWYYNSPSRIDAPEWMKTDELIAVLEKFDGIYCYLCQDYDTESQWEERGVDAFDRSLDDDSEDEDYDDSDPYEFKAENMSDLEFKVQKLFPEGCYPLSFCFDDFSSCSNGEEEEDRFFKPGWHPLMMLSDNDWYCLDFVPEEGGKIARIIRVVDKNIEVVADNIIQFIEKIMIPKIEKIIS